MSASLHCQRQGGARPSRAQQYTTAWQVWKSPNAHGRWGERPREPDPRRKRWWGERPREPIRVGHYFRQVVECGSPMPLFLRESLKLRPDYVAF